MTDITTVKQRFGIIGTSPLLDRALEVALRVAPTDLTVLVTGESGVGKEFFPQVIHAYSARKHNKYIAVNCAAIPEGTIDSELFGHEKGAFTGALEARKGYFEEADGGTIFLDEVAELPHSTQARLLRVLQTGEFIRVGSSKVQKTNVRVVAATNVNLQEAIAKGRFREDLYYRLGTVPILVPSLRERPEDIPLLFRRFAADVAVQYNCFYSNGFKSRDRSQPPVGSLVVWMLYKQYKEKWFLELLYKELLTWNRWWSKNREDKGLLCLGSNPYEKVTYFRSEFDTNCHYGAVLESGLDNSPMYDGVSFNKQKHLLEQQDVGISSLYVMDCDYLALIAEELNYKKDAMELRERADYYRTNLKGLWDEKTGFYYNRSTRTMDFNYRTSPTCFYPLLAKVPTQNQAERMVKEHLLNTNEFWGKYVIPSVPKNDPAFKDNEYWRGRIWAPLNFLVYMGLNNYEFREVKRLFAEKSKNLLLKSWLSHGYVFENYNALTGIGDDVVRSDKFYHWGALLGYISLMENGVVCKYN